MRTTWNGRSSEQTLAHCWKWLMHYICKDKINSNLVNKYKTVFSICLVFCFGAKSYWLEQLPIVCCQWAFPDSITMSCWRARWLWQLTKDPTVTGVIHWCVNKWPYRPLMWLTRLVSHGFWVTDFNRTINVLFLIRRLGALIVIRMLRFHPFNGGTSKCIFTGAT